MSFLTKIKEESTNGYHDTISDNIPVKFVVLNTTSCEIEKFGLSKNIVVCDYFKDNDSFIYTKDKVDFLFVIYDDDSVITNGKIKDIIDNAKKENVTIYLSNMKEKSIEEIVAIYNEIFNLLCESGIVNIELEDMKGCDIVDAFVVTKKEGVDFKQEYIETFKNHISKIDNVSQIVMSINGGENTKVDEMYEYIASTNLIFPEGIDVIFGTNTIKDKNGLYKIVVILQKDRDNKSSRNRLVEKLELAHEEFMAKKKNKKVKTIEDEFHDSQFYKLQIQEFCELDVVSTAKIQRYLRVVYPKAYNMINDWSNKGYIVKKEGRWVVVDKKAIFDYLNKFFKDKL